MERAAVEVCHSRLVISSWGNDARVLASGQGSKLKKRHPASSTQLIFIAKQDNGNMAESALQGVL